MWRRSLCLREKPNKSKDFADLGKNRCVFLFPQSDDITGGLPQGIGFGERKKYILAKGYFFAKESGWKTIMKEKIADDKYYKVLCKKGSHLNEKINEDGSRSAIQFHDDSNGLDGLVDIVEVDEKELAKIREQNDISPILKYVIDNILAPYITRELEKGTDYLLDILGERVIPKTKEKAKKLKKNAGLYLSAFREALTGKEPKAVCLMQKEICKKEETEVLAVESTEVINEQKNDSNNTKQQKDVRSIEEVQQLLDIMRTNAISLASCIRILSNTIVKDDGKNPEATLEMQKEFEKLSSEEMMKQIGLLLEDKNRDLLDESSIKILAAFREGKFIVEDKLVPISNFIKIQ